MGNPCESSCTLLPFGTSRSSCFQWDEFFESESGLVMSCAREDEAEISIMTSTIVLRNDEVTG
ncbi:MAG: hypothetical protein P8Y79_10930, partial [Ignavibacteriaceae bacterium]